MQLIELACECEVAQGQVKHVNGKQGHGAAVGKQLCGGASSSSSHGLDLINGLIDSSMD